MMETPTPISMEDRERMTAPLSNNVVWPNLNYFLNATQTESSSTYQGLCEVQHQGATGGTDVSNSQIGKPDYNHGAPDENSKPQHPTIPLAHAFQGAPSSSRAGGKRRVPSAAKDEWADSSDEEAVVCVAAKSSHASEYFGPTTTDTTDGNRRKKSKAARNHREPRFHRMSGPKQVSSKPLSMSRNAVDYRDRKEITKDYKDKVCALIDQDILDRVDSEGGITPEGRVYKAVLEMMQRGSRQGGLKQVVTPPNSSPGSSDEIARLQRENKALRRRIQEASKTLGSK